ncbi:hypothetical protein BGZ83_002343 [Gryganskiella cystojenkinii]|nr:hypothetical protein BGZ83_002343 [Gryganskiella cystojenkinii]
MATTEPLRPFCFAATSKGVVYAASFAYLDSRFDILSPEPNYFVILKGEPASVSVPSSDQDTNNNDNLLIWTAVTATERANVIVGAEVIPGSGLSCGVTEDETRFMLHARTDGDSPQSSTVQVLLSETLYNTSNSSNNGPFARIQTALDQRVPGRSFVSYLTLTPVQDLMPSNSTSTLATSSRQPYGDWIQFIRGGAIPYIQSVNGSFPSETQGSSELKNQLSRFPEAMTVSNKTVYSLLSGDVQWSLMQTRFVYNSSSPSSLEILPQTELAFVFPSDQTHSCSYGRSAMNIRYPNLYILCVSYYYEKIPSRLFRINLETRSFSQASIQFSKNTNRQKFDYYSGVSWRLMSVSESTLLLAEHSVETGSNLYSINVETGFLDTYTLNYIPNLHPNNPNPDISRSPLTLSDLESVLITVAALALALLHIWIKEQALKRKMRKRKGEDWFEEDDIPGSKLAEEMDEETFQAYQRQEQERIQRHLQENGDQIENEHRIYSDVAVSTSFETTNVHRGSPPNNNNVNTSSSSREVLTQELSASSPLFRADGLEQLGFSSHPRPNVVTTIPDDDSVE